MAGNDDNDGVIMKCGHDGMFVMLYSEKGDVWITIVI